MHTQKLIGTVLIPITLTATAGCATTSFYAEAAERDQRAADALRRGGATEAARAAQSRADENRKNATCRTFEDCLFDALLSIRIGR